MNSLLKCTLSEQIQMMDHDFMCLEFNFPNANDLQMRSLEAVTISIDSLRCTIDDLLRSDAPVSPMLRHDIRNQLTIIRGFAELLKHKRAGHLAAECVIFVDKIVNTTRLIEVTLHTSKEISEVFMS